MIILKSIIFIRLFGISKFDSFEKPYVQLALLVLQELSGLGDRKKLNQPSVDDRFVNMNAVAQTRSIVALGLSTFHHLDDYRYQVDTFNLITLCSEDYIVEPGALKFLVEHGFDFQKQYSSGLPYSRGQWTEVGANWVSIAFHSSWF